MEEQRTLYHPRSISEPAILSGVWNDTTWQRWQWSTTQHYQNSRDIPCPSKCIHRSAITALYWRVWTTLSCAYQTLFWSRISKRNGCWRYQHVYEEGKCIQGWTSEQRIDTTIGNDSSSTRDHEEQSLLSLIIASKSRQGVWSSVYFSISRSNSGWI